jgi:hypothetical protein
LVVILVSACGSVPRTTREDGTSGNTGDGPTILFWTAHPTEVKSASHIVNTVWVGDPADPGDHDLALHQSAWLARGIVPLDWAGGRVHATQPIEEFAGRWISQIDAGYVGIAIDEFGDQDREVDRRLVEGLRNFRGVHQHATVAIWHAGPVRRDLAEAYWQHADIVMLERYVSGRHFLGVRFGPLVRAAKRRSIEEIAIVAIGVDDERWASSPPEIEAQVSWLRKHAPYLDGIAVFAPRASLDLVRAADEIVARWYLE